MTVTITEPTIDHAEAISTVCAAGWKQTVEGLLSGEYQEENVALWYNLNCIKKDIQAGFYSHIALIDSKVAGVIGGVMTGPGAAEVFVFYVDEEYRYQGVGRQLLNALSQMQLESGALEQWVSVQEGNQKGIPFYEAQGFLYKEKRAETTSTGEQQVSLRYSREL